MRGLLGAAASMLVIILFTLATDSIGGHDGLAAVVTTATLASLLVVRTALPRPPDRPRRASAVPREGPVFTTSRYVRAGSLVFSAAGDRREWDYTVRPQLARLYETLASENHPGTDAQRRELGPQLLGEELWAYVDPDRPKSNQRTPGPGADALAEILERLESL